LTDPWQVFRWPLIPVQPRRRGSHQRPERLHDNRAEQALELIRPLQGAGRALPPLLGPADGPTAQQQRRKRAGHRRLLPQQPAVPVVGLLKQWLEEQKLRALPKTPLGQAVGYALNKRDGAWAAGPAACRGPRFGTKGGCLGGGLGGTTRAQTATAAPPGRPGVAVIAIDRVLFPLDTPPSRLGSGLQVSEILE
jgi:hypothetical protein